MKKWILSLTLAVGVMGLAACNNGGSETVVESKSGDVTKDELYDAMKDKYGEATLQELVYTKVLSEKYKVTDKELDAKVKELKDQYGDSFELVLQQNNINGEKELKKIFKNEMLIQKAAMKDVKVTDKELQDYYKDYKPQIKASHILVADKKTANQILSKLEKGEKFEDLAKKYSTDTGSAEKGGDLGWFGPGEMVAEFENAAYALKVNEISKPVKSEHGYHVIKLTDKKEKKSFDEMKKQMEEEVKLTKLDNDTIQKALKRELKDADVKVKDEDLKDIFSKSTASAQ
ncbi:peptidylprolyl isomerase [Bacillus massilinigeriensis]|uniref:peptidylprolyl isomerase n=1 Tax=Bacillus massilionigeriensis TaxID=1805475 RepID=UPI00096B26FE|nr:peptidylprolyl isomerase [Bacillus massilionigeriensis]